MTRRQWLLTLAAGVGATVAPRASLMTPHNVTFTYVSAQSRLLTPAERTWLYNNGLDHPNIAHLRARRET